MKPQYIKRSRKTPKVTSYKPVIILSNVSKIYERCIYDQIQLFFDSILAKYQCRLRKDYTKQHCLITLFEKRKKSVGNSSVVGALLTDRSKAFDCPPYELLFAKLDASGFSKSSLKLIHRYLSNRKQRVKINEKYCSWSEILFVVPQGAIKDLSCSIFSYAICLIL